MYDFEFKRGHSFAQKFDGKEWRRVGIPFLAAVPNKVLAGVIDGTLAKDWVSGDPELVALYGEWRPLQSAEDESGEYVESAESIDSVCSCIATTRQL